jgi:hypothetical protein
VLGLGSTLSNANHGLGKGCNALKTMAQEKQTEDILVQMRQSQVSLKKIFVLNFKFFRHQLIKLPCS